MSKRKHTLNQPDVDQLSDVLQTGQRVANILDEYKMTQSGLSNDAKLAAEKIQRILDASPLTMEQKRKAVHDAAKQLGVPITLTAKPGDKLSFGGGTTAGEISFNREQIPSVTGGKSPAMDFVHALQSGNPEAERLAREATGGHYDLIQNPDGSLSAPPKKEQSLADVFIASTYDWCRYFNYTAKQEKQAMPFLNHYRQSLRHAHRFELQNDFTQYATEVSNRTPAEKLLYRLQFATLPYETTWIEFNLHVKVRVMRKFHGFDDLPEGVSNRMGILLKRIDETSATVEMVGEAITDNMTCPCLHGYVYSLNEREFAFGNKLNGMTPFSMQRRRNELLDKKDPMWADLEARGVTEVIDALSHGSLWGYGRESNIVDGTNIARNLVIPQALMKHGELAFSPFYDFFEVAGFNNLQIMQRLSKTMTDEIAEFTGMMRWVVTVLAMLNEVPTRTEFAQPRHTVRAGLTKRLPAFDYHRITLKLPKTKPVPYIERHLANVERKHRAHMVREHWRTYLSEHPCPVEEHAWEYDYENGYRLCGKCMTHSTLIHEHKRGDETLGWIHHEYTVKKGRE